MLCILNYDLSQPDTKKSFNKKKLKSVGMTLAKVKEQDGMMLAKVKVPSIPTSAACCDDVQLTNVESSSYTFYNCQLLNWHASSKPQIPSVVYNCVN